MHVQTVIAITALRRRSQHGWYASLQYVRAMLGARCGTIAVSEGEWLEHWRAGLDPVGALLAELRD
jgi:hypothetical protein